MGGADGGVNAKGEGLKELVNKRGLSFKKVKGELEIGVTGN